MNKKLITLAVAAALVAPTAAMADAVIYGKLHVSIDYAEVDGTDLQQAVARAAGTEYNGYKGWGLNGQDFIPGVTRANRLGVKGSEDLGNGLKAIYQVEFGVPLSDSDFTSTNGDPGKITMRNSFLGLAGDWGTFFVGRHDTPLKISTAPLDLFSDTMADYNGTVGFVDLRADNAVAYISPTFYGFQLAGAVVPGGGHTNSGYNNLNSDSLSEAYSLAGIYKNGPFYASVAYENLGTQLGASTITTPQTGDLFADANAVNTAGLAPVDYYVPVTDAAGTVIGYAPGRSPETLVRTPNSAWDYWRVGLGLLDWNGFTLTAIYEGHNNYSWFQDQNRDLWQIQAGYAFGNNMIKGMYGWMSTDFNFQPTTNIGNTFRSLTDDNANTWAVAFDHNFSKRTKAYILYTDVTDSFGAITSDGSWTGFSLGMIHSF